MPRRQDLPPAFHRDGSVYATRRDVVVDRNSLYGDRLVAAGGQINVVTARCKRFDKLAGGLRIVLNDKNAAVPSGHGLASPGAAKIDFSKVWRSDIPAAATLTQI